MSPLREVLAAVQAGAGSVPELVRRTGLDRDLVVMAIDRLVDLGRIRAQDLPGCSGGGCGSCEAPCTPTPGTGPVLLRFGTGRP